MSSFATIRNNGWSSTPPPLATDSPIENGWRNLPPPAVLLYSDREAPLLSDYTDHRWWPIGCKPLIKKSFPTGSFFRSQSLALYKSFLKIILLFCPECHSKARKPNSVLILCSTYLKAARSILPIHSPEESSFLSLSKVIYDFMFCTCFIDFLFVVCTSRSATYRMACRINT